MFDQRGDNKIAGHQLGDVLRAMGQNPTEAEVKKTSHSNDPGKLTIGFHSVENVKCGAKYLKACNMYRFLNTLWRVL